VLDDTTTGCRPVFPGRIPFARSRIGVATAMAGSCGWPKVVNSRLARPTGAAGASPALVASGG
jgi:hypothetical protein